MRFLTGECEVSESEARNLFSIAYNMINICVTSNRKIIPIIKNRYEIIIKSGKHLRTNR